MLLYMHLIWHKCHYFNISHIYFTTPPPSFLIGPYFGDSPRPIGLFTSGQSVCRHRETFGLQGRHPGEVNCIWSNLKLQWHCSRTGLARPGLQMMSATAVTYCKSLWPKSYNSNELLTLQQVSRAKEDMGVETVPSVYVVFPLILPFYYLLCCDCCVWRTGDPMWAAGTNDASAFTFVHMHFMCISQIFISQETFRDYRE